jgi:hypothetical protein
MCASSCWDHRNTVWLKGQVPRLYSCDEIVCMDDAFLSIYVVSFMRPMLQVR